MIKPERYNSLLVLIKKDIILYHINGERYNIISILMKKDIMLYQY